MIYFYMALGIWYFLYILYTVYLYLNCSRPYASEITGIFNKAPNAINPARLSMLMHKKITPESLTSSILILIKKKNLLLKSQDNKYYIYKSNNIINISESQKLIMDLLINTIGDTEKVSVDDIYHFCESNRNSSNFLNDYHLWKKVTFKEIMQYNYFEPKTIYIHIKDVRLLGIVLFILNILLGYHTFLGYFIIIPALLLMTYFKKIYKRTKEANDEYYKWIGYKAYLNSLDKNTVNQDELWMLYIYGLILGVNINNNASKFIIDLNNGIKRCFIRSNLYGNRNLFTR